MKQEINVTQATTKVLPLVVFKGLMGHHINELVVVTYSSIFHHVAVFWKMFNKKTMVKMELAADKHAREQGYNIDGALIYLASFNSQLKESLVKQGRIS